MKLARYVQHIKQNLHLYIIILMVMIISDDCYWFTTADSRLLVMVKFAFYVLFPFYLYIKFRFPRVNIVPLVLMTLLFCISALLGGASLIGGPAVLFLIFLSSVIIADAIDFKVFANCYVEVTNIIMIYSCLVWAGAMVGVISLSEIENIAGARIRTAGFCTFFSDYFGVILRNGAIFREPGVFMVFINIAFLFESVYLKHNLSMAKLVLYAGCMLTTVSTAGLIILFLAYLLYIYNQRKSVKSFILPLLFMILCIVLLMGSEELLGDIFSKFDRGMESGSVAGRITSLTIPATIMLHNPLFGVGAESFASEYIHYGQEIYHMYINPQGLSTNTILNAGAVYGLWFAMYLIINFYNLSKQLVYKKRIQALYVFMLFLMMFSNESMFYSMIVYILIFYGSRNRNKSFEVR